MSSDKQIIADYFEYCLQEITRAGRSLDKRRVHWPHMLSLTLSTFSKKEDATEYLKHCYGFVSEALASLKQNVSYTWPDVLNESKDDVLEAAQEEEEDESEDDDMSDGEGESGSDDDHEVVYEGLIETESDDSDFNPSATDSEDDASDSDADNYDRNIVKQLKDDESRHQENMAYQRERAALRAAREGAH